MECIRKQCGCTTYAQYGIVVNDNNTTATRRKKNIIIIITMTKCIKCQMKFRHANSAQTYTYSEWDTKKRHIARFLCHGFCYCFGARNSDKTMGVRRVDGFAWEYSWNQTEHFYPFWIIHLLQDRVRTTYVCVIKIQYDFRARRHMTSMVSVCARERNDGIKQRCWQRQIYIFTINKWILLWW